MTLFEFLPVMWDPAGPIIFLGAFGFLKKAFKKLKKIGGGALAFVPGGGIIKQGLNVAKVGFGSIVRGFQGQPKTGRPQNQLGQPIQSTAFQNTTFGAGRNMIFGLERNTFLTVAGVAVVAFIVLSARKR